MPSGQGGASSFVQPAIPGYSPKAVTNQDSPFLRTPGVQGLQEGIAGGQGQAFTPTQQFYGGGTEGTAPPSSIAPGGGDMWSKFSGSGGAPSSLAQGNMMAMAQALRAPGAAPVNSFAPARREYADLMNR